MSYTGPELLAHTLVSANDFRTLLYRAVDFAGTLSTANGANAAGIALTSPNCGQHMRVGIIGVMKVTAGAAITTPGYPLTTAASGYIVAAVSGANVVGRYLGTAAAASGAMITGLFNFTQYRPIGAGSGYV